jgi:hypothetical protein
MVVARMALQSVSADLRDLSGMAVQLASAVMLVPVATSTQAAQWALVVAWVMSALEAPAARLALAAQRVVSAP